MQDDTPGCNLVNSMQMRNLTAVCDTSGSEVYDMAVALCAYGAFTWQSPLLQLYHLVFYFYCCRTCVLLMESIDFVFLVFFFFPPLVSPPLLMF